MQKSKKVKIKIKTEKGKNINLPALRIGFLQSVFTLAVKFIKIPQDKERDLCYKLNNLDKKDIKMLFDALKTEEPFVLVDIIDEKTGTKVEIYTK